MEASFTSLLGEIQALDRSPAVMTGRLGRPRPLRSRAGRPRSPALRAGYIGITRDVTDKADLGLIYVDWFEPLREECLWQ
jgi:hypothetical protein